MRKISIEDVDVEVNPQATHSVRRPLSEALGTDHFAMNYFELEPGETFSGGLHAHHDQEEVFYVQSGVATFEVADEPDSGAAESVTVEAGELIRFSPGEFQTGYNESDTDERVVGLAFGAPTPRHDWSEIEAAIPCRECDDETGHEMAPVDGGFEFTCMECGNRFST